MDKKRWNEISVTFTNSFVGALMILASVLGGIALVVFIVAIGFKIWAPLGVLAIVVVLASIFAILHTMEQHFLGPHKG